MTLIIGNTDVTDMIAFNGLTWTRSDIDGPNAGRSLSGTMIRDRVATKIRLDITCKPLESDELSALLNAIYPEFVTVTYDDPMMGTRQVTMYSNNNPAQYLIMREDGTEYWNGITFPLIEK